MADSLHHLQVSNPDFPLSSARILNSWKEISAYLGRGVRTIQRYEQKLGLPVHRPAMRKRSAVLAFSDELERWLRNAPTRDATSPDSTNGNSLHIVEDKIERENDSSKLERAKQEMERCYTAYVRAREHYNALKHGTDNRQSNGKSKRTP